MSKGKYSARAANRRATFDNEVIAELRGELAAAKAALAEARQEHAQHIAQRDADFVAAVDEAVAAERRAIGDERARLARELDSLRSAARMWIRGYVAVLTREHTGLPVVPAQDLLDVAHELFGAVQADFLPVGAPGASRAVRNKAKSVDTSAKFQNVVSRNARRGLE